MSTFENIDGIKLSTIFQQLISQKVLVKVYLTKADYESLTLIIDTTEDGKRPIFRIDVPKGLNDAIAKTKSKRLSFEFYSSDQVVHRFKSDIDTVSGDSISLFYPPHIQRHQQRDNFRVKAPSNSYAVLSFEHNQIQMEVENISLGGAYCYCLNKYKSMLAQDLTITDMELVFGQGNQTLHVSIQRAIVKRVENRHRPKHFGVAFEFTNINSNFRKLLVQYIYGLQRSFLQNRLKAF